MPYHFDPRQYQLPFLRAMDSGFIRACLVWHRRAGKDKTLVNFTAKKMMERVGAYYYFFPTYGQGRKILWRGMDKDGFRFLDHIPQDLRRKTLDQEMMIELKNGSLFQVVGTDNIDSIVGTNPVGCVFSEYALQDPAAWDFIRPILAENGGWAVFNFTPRGDNHGKQIFLLAQNSDKWFCQLLKASDTKAIPKEVLEQERAEYIAKDGNDATYQQEYECSFEVPIAGAYFGAQIMKATEEGRIGTVPYEPQLPVTTYWDLGIGDSMAIWFAQKHGRDIRIIDYYETNGEGMAHYAAELQNRGYVYDGHWMPHDAQVREIGTGKTRKEVAETLGLRPIHVAPRLPVDDGIEATRNMLARCWFDAKKCERGLNALKSYHKEYDEKNRTYKSHPHHDWTSHGADALRTMATSGSAFDDTLPPKKDKNWAIGD